MLFSDCFILKKKRIILFKISNKILFKKNLNCHRSIICEHIFRILLIFKTRRLYSIILQILINNYYVGLAQMVKEWDEHL